MIHYADLNNVLASAIADGGQVSRDRLEFEARASDELFTTFPIYAALTTWGDEGLNLIVRIAMDGDTVKSKSAALTLLAKLATSGKLSTEREFMIWPALAELINDKLDPPAMAKGARHALRILVLSLPTDDLLLPLSQSFMHMTLQSQESAQELAASLSAKWLKFAPPVLDQFEQMFVTCSNDEPAFQFFFCEFPQLLDPMAAQVWSQPDFHGVLEPDFVIRRADDSYLVVEIECPGKLILTKGGQLSHSAVHAEKQVLDYESFLSERISEALTHFPGYQRADCLAVIGLEQGLTTEQHHNLDRVNSRRQNLKIVGFDWLLQRARTIVENIGEGRIDVIGKHRIT